MYGSNCKKIVLDIDEQKLTAVLLSGSLYVKPTFYMGEESFIELETQRLPTEVNRNNTIGIDLLFKEKTIDDENIKKEILAVARLIYHLRTVQDRLPENPPMMKPDYNNKKYIQNLQEYYDNYLSKGMEFDISKIEGAISLARNIEQDFNLKIDSLNKIVDDSNMSSVMEDMLTILDKIKSETETPELSRQRNTRRYAYFYELYMKTLEAVASKPKQFGETNTSKTKKRLEKEEEESGEEETILGTFIKRAEEKLTQRQWRSYKTSAERINRLWNICNKNFAILDLVTILTPNLFERLPTSSSNSGSGSESGRGRESGSERERGQGSGRGRGRGSGSGSGRERGKGREGEELAVKEKQK
ncbi:unnamed protein product [Rhizophagus irregularis]|nr:unnamed protein product [Rhizophagus irregularis]